MKITNFLVDCLDEELPAIQFDDGTWYFSAQAVCAFAELCRPQNAPRWVNSHIPSKWTQEIKIPGKEGRPALYLTKPGLYFALCQGKSDIALKFRDEVFEVILPKIDASGAYILPNATSEQLAALQGEIEVLQKTIVHSEQKLIAAQTTIAQTEQKLSKVEKMLVVAPELESKFELLKRIDGLKTYWKEKSRAGGPKDNLTHQKYLAVNLRLDYLQEQIGKDEIGLPLANKTFKLIAELSDRLIGASMIDMHDIEKIYDQAVRKLR